MDPAPTSLSAHFLVGRERLFTYALALMRSHTVAEDIVQDVYLTLLRVEHDETIADLPAWCRGVARNLALRHWQEGQRIERLPAIELLDGIDQTFAEDGEDDQALMQALAACRGNLATPAVALLDMKYLQDLPMRTIAERTRRSERAVITALARIRKKLMDCIATRIAGAGHA